MKGFIELTKVEIRLLSRNVPSMFFALIFPSLTLLMFGGMYGNKPSPYLGGHGTIDLGVPAYTGIVIAVAGLMNLPLAISNYREKKVLKRFMATPMSARDVLVSRIIVNILMTIVGMAILIIIGRLIFDLHFMGSLLPISIAFVLSTLSIFSLGLLIASLSPNSSATTGIAYLIYFPSLFLTGATTPIEVMPKVMVNISKAIPLTYAVDLLKSAWLGKDILNYRLDIVVLIAVLVVCSTISFLTFRWE